MGASTSRERGRPHNIGSSFLSKPDTNVTITSAVQGHLLFATASMQGWRSSMEDVHVANTNFMPGHALFAVMDGHAGEHVAHYVGDNLATSLKKHMIDLRVGASRSEVSLAIKTAFLELDADIAKKFGRKTIGGTTCTGVIVNDSWYHFFNVGDSRTVLCADGAVKFATRDHKPDDSIEFHRIQNAGGFVSRGRVKGQLAVSRAFGDMEYKTKFSAHPREQMVSVEPTCTSVARTESDEFIMIACDGIWDVMSSDSAVGFVQQTLYQEMTQPRRQLSRTSQNKKTPHAVLALEQTCAKLVGACLAKGSSDNMSCVVIIPVPNPPPDPETPSPTPSLTESEAAEVLAEDAVSSAVRMAVSVAASMMSPERTRLQRSLTMTSNSPEAHKLRAMAAATAASTTSTA